MQVKNMFIFISRRRAWSEAEADMALATLSLDTQLKNATGSVVLT